MKTIYAICTFLVFAAATSLVKAQDYPEEYLGLPGDNLNLYAVMDLFQQSETLEKFEKDLNSEELMINNLDLNRDNLIDYITVSDYVDGKIHNIVLRAALDRNEQQDVAVFVVEQMANGAVQIQLIGDEALYGPNYIVEPIYAETPNPGYTGKVYRNNVNVVTTTYYDIAAWPVIRYIYRPGYMVWRSSWYWGYYPRYWRPWRAHYWHYYYGYHYHWHHHYYTHYRHWNHYRCRDYQTYYRSKVRVYSPTVAVNINNNRYRNTYSRPEQRREGEAYYARTASRRDNATRPGVYSGRTENRSGTVASRQATQRTGSSAIRTSATRSNVTRTSANRSSVTGTSATRNAATRTRSNVSTTGRSSNAVRSTSSSRSNSVRSENNRAAQPVNRSAVRPTTQRSTNVKATPSVQRSQPARSSSVQHSQPNRSSSVQRSQPSRSSSVQRSSSNSKKSAPSVQRSSSSRKSAPSVQRSSSSSRKSTDSRSSSSSARRR